MRASFLLGVFVGVLAGCSERMSGDPTLVPRLDASSPLEPPSGPALGRDAGSVRVPGPPPDAGRGRACVHPGETVGVSCWRDEDCDDFCFCNGTEACSGGRCVAGAAPCEDDFACTFRACDEAANACGPLELDDSVCAEGGLCGVATCDARLGCVDGGPFVCSDGDSCTIDSCDPVRGCLYTPRDLDGDGFVDARCTDPDDPAGDCVDSDPEVSPAARELCANGRDDDCDGLADLRDPDCRRANGTCVTAATVPGTGVYAAGTGGLRDDLTLGCGPGGPEAVFAFTVTEPSTLEASLVGAPLGSALALRGPGTVSVCEDDAGEAAGRCATAVSFVSPARLFVDRIAPGTYWLIAESPREAAFDLALDLGRAPSTPAWDACATAPRLGRGRATLSGRWNLLADRHAAAECGGPGSTDACYRIDLDAPADVDMRFGSFLASGAPSPGVVTLLGDPEAPAASGLACSVSAAASHGFRSENLPAGTYYALVERGELAATSFVLDAFVAPPTVRPPCDTCALACDADRTRVRSRLTDLRLDRTTLGCGASLGPGWVDATYTFTTTLPGESVRVDVVSPGLVAFAIDDASGTCPPVSASFCQAGSGTFRRTLSVPEVGTHRLSVAALSLPGDLEVEVTPSGVVR
ncbi:MAG: putative metal-binding motif-containing protein [Myxococcota bacterium]